MFKSTQSFVFHSILFLPSDATSPHNCLFFFIFLKQFFSGNKKLFPTPFSPCLLKLRSVLDLNLLQLILINVLALRLSLNEWLNIAEQIQFLNSLRIFNLNEHVQGVYYYMFITSFFSPDIHFLNHWMVAFTLLLSSENVISVDMKDVLISGLFFYPLLEWK